jgi:hypothetical protein
MRINPETFLALTVLLGTGAAVGVAVVTSSADEPAAIEESVDAVTAQAAATESSEPAAPTSAITTPVTPATITPTETTTPVVEEPWVDPFPIVPDDPNWVPGPDVEGF